MKAGQLRHLITIEQPTETRDSMGGTITVWVPFATLWAAVEPISGREYFAADKVNAEESHRIRIRHYPGITSKMRAKWNDRTFNIRAVLNIQERNREIHLMCLEVV